jgi:tRNA(fMet)-specific endonuclease VapC
VSLYVLDTDSLSLYQRGDPVVAQHVLAHPATDLAITVITVEEQLSGWYTLLRRSRTPDRVALAYQRLADAVPFLARFPILPFPESAILRFEQLLTLRLRIGAKDLRIAAITLENSAILVSRNLRDFRRVPGLTVEDWSV